MAGFVSDKRLYVNADKSKIVEEGSPEAAFLLVGKGGTVSEEDAKKYNLRASSRKTEAEDDEAESKAEAKQIEAPPENKAQSMRSVKDK